MSATDSFLTPPAVAEWLLRMGGVGLDPCSNMDSMIQARRRIMLPEHVRGVRPIGVEIGSGLDIDWGGNGLVWCNPPYSRPAPWLERMTEPVDEIIYLIPAATSEGWWHDFVVPYSTEILFVKGRMTFWERWADGVVRPAKYPARFSSAFVYQGDRAHVFRSVFAHMGWFAKAS